MICAAWWSTRECVSLWISWITHKLQYTENE